MDKEFISYEQALALKELGFDEPVIAMYKEEFKKDLHATMYWSKDNRNSMWIKGVISAPTYSAAFRWFREKHRLYPIIDSFVGVKGVVKFFYKLPMYDKTFNTYEEAESACLDKLIEICKNKENDNT